MIKKIVYFVFGIPITLIALLGIIGSAGDKSPESPIMVFATLMALGIFLLFFGMKTSTGKKRKEELIALGVISEAFGKHMAGLPLAEGTFCNIYEHEDKFVFNAGGSDFTLLKNKITDVSMKTDEEITSQYVSSVGGAVAGAVLFGPLGAMVGGRSKKKKSKTVNNYLIFTFMKESTVDYISFDVTASFGRALKICTDFKKNQTATKVSVDL